MSNQVTQFRRVMWFAVGYAVVVTALLLYAMGTKFAVIIGIMSCGGQ